MTTGADAHSVDSSFKNSPVDDGPFAEKRFAVVNVAGIEVADLTEAETIARIERLVSDGGGHYMVVVNAAKAVMANRDPALLDIIKNADLVTADGMSVLLASKLLRHPLRERVTGIDLFEKLVAEAERLGLAVYLLGASEDSVRGVVELLTKRHPRLRVAGFQNGYFDRSTSLAVADAIHRSLADLLFVAMGSPAQEYWISANLSQSGVKFALGVGGAFDHLSGRSKRAPLWMQRSGLEWLYRLMKEPRRLWRRYLVGNSKFTWLVFRQLFSRRQVSARR